MITGIFNYLRYKLIHKCLFNNSQCVVLKVKQQKITKHNQKKTTIQKYTNSKQAQTLI